MTWETVIGLETHVELATRTKIFCSCTTAFGGAPNTHCCPVCTGMPGTLPVMNKAVMRYAAKAGLALNCDITRYHKFDRKNYFYPDLPKAYQISQLYLPIATNGKVPIRLPGGEEKIIRIHEMHMEEDAGKLVHDPWIDQTRADYNRCGVPLIEIVTEPDFRTAEEVIAYLEKLKSTLEYLGVSDCKMQEGSLRCDVNLSVRPAGSTELGTRTEMKNINSFKSLHDALEYEICRQAEVLEEGGIIYQETRHWEPSRRRTVVMRVKETADDYRLFPDPDLAPFGLTDDFIEKAREKIPELPDAKRDRYMHDYGLKRADAAQLAGDPSVAVFFEEALEGAPTKAVATIANVMVNLAPSFDALTPAQVRSIAGLLAEDAITFAQAREVLEAVNGTDKDPEHVVDERGMRQVTDTAALEPIVDEVLARCTDQVQQYHDGNKKVVGYLVGQCMKASKGSGNPKLFNKLLTARLEG